MSGYQLLGGVPPFQVIQQQNAGLPPGSIPPWYAQQYPAGYVPPLLVSVDNPLEPDPIDAFDDAIRFRGQRDRQDLAQSHLFGVAVPVADVITSPTVVIVNPKGLASTRFENPARVVVTPGSERFKGYLGDPSTIAYEAPKSVIVTLANGTKKAFAKLEFASVRGGSQLFDVAGMKGFAALTQRMTGAPTTGYAILGHGGGGGHGGHHGGGGWGPWSYPAGYALQVPFIYDDGDGEIPGADVDALAEAVARKIEERKTHVGALFDGTETYDAAEREINQLVAYFDSLHRPYQWESAVEAVYASWEKLTKGWSALGPAAATQTKWLRANEAKQIGQDASDLMAKIAASMQWTGTTPGAPPTSTTRNAPAPSALANAVFTPSVDKPSPPWSLPSIPWGWIIGIGGAALVAFLFGPQIMAAIVATAAKVKGSSLVRESQ